MSSCLSCAELEAKICALSDEIAAASCDTLVTKEGDTTIDKTEGIKAKIEVLKTYQDLYKMKNCGASEELYEFVHTPCVQPTDCIGEVCLNVPRVRNQRRYRR